MSRRGRFITFEGTEGVGKTTNIQYVRQQLEAAGIATLVTREPGGTPLAEEIRRLLLAHREEAVDATTELLLIFAARAQHLNRRIFPALEAGTWVLCDRFTDATYAYQGGGRKLPMDQIQTLETLVQGYFRPDHVIWLDAPVALGMERAGKRGPADRFEAEDQAFFERIRAVYRQRAEQEPDRYRRIPADQPLEAVQTTLAEWVGRWVSQWQEDGDG